VFSVSGGGGSEVRSQELLFVGKELPRTQ